MLAKFGAEFDYSQVASEIRKMGTDWGKKMRLIEKTSDRSMKGVFKGVKEAMWKASGAHKAYHKLYMDQLKKEGKGLDKLNKSMVNNKHAMREMGAELRHLQKSIKSATEPLEKENLAKAIDAARGKLRKLANERVDISDQKESIHEGSEEIKEKFEFDPKEVTDAALDAGEEIGDLISAPLKAVLSKDVPTMAKLAGKILGRGFGAVGGGLGKLGAKMSAAGGGGGAMGKMGDIIGKLGTTLKTLGPILSMAAGAIASIVQLLIDAEAGAKEFNKNILSTAGSSEFLHKNLKSVGAGAQDLEDTLTKIRDQATSLDNLDWGINKETHQAVLNAITAEGVSLKKLDESFKQVGKDSKGAAGYASDWSKLTQMSVAYSLAFGVSLQEIGQLEGEMMTDLGMNLVDVETSFQYMIRGAEEAGIATNKFFNIIRGFSGDLTLFTLRMEDITKVMIGLGKAMSPRDAQKFLQGVTGFFKNQGLGERTKHVLMGGRGSADYMKSFDKKLEGLAGRIGAETGQELDPQILKQVLKKSDKELAKWIADNGEGMTDDTKKAIYEAARQQSKIVAGTPVDLASAIGNLDPFDTMEQLQSESMKMFGKKFEELKGVERLGAEQAMGVSDEQQDAFAKLNMAVEQMQADLAHKLEKGIELTDSETDALKALKIDGTAGAAAKKLRDFKAKQVWDAMSADQKRLLQDGKTEIDFQKETSKFQTSVQDKIGILVDFVMNQLYKILSDTYDALLDLVDKVVGGDNTKSRREQLQESRMVQKSGNSELISAFGKAQGDTCKMREELQKGTFGKMGQAIDKQVEKMTNLQKKLDDPKTPADQKAQLSAELALAKAHFNEMKKLTLKNISSDDALKIIKGKLSEQDFDKVQKKLDELKQNPAFTGDVTDAMSQAGIDPAVIGDAMKEAMNQFPFQAMVGGLDKMQKAIEAANPPETVIAAQMVGGLDKMQKAIEDANPPETAIAAQKMLTPHSIYVHDTHAEKRDEETQDALDEHGGSLDDIYRALRFRGIKIDRPFLENNVKKVITDGVYDAASDALFDYAMLTNADAVSKWAQTADEQGTTMGDLKSFSRVASQYYQQNPVAGLAPVARTGGATVGAAAGGQVVELRLKGDLARIIDARAQNQIANHERNRTKR
jgi:hypothetical protein